MVFMKNPVKGKVKTRLAATVGEDKALEVYTILLRQTVIVANETQICDKAIFYSDLIDKNDVWCESNTQKYLQQGKDLGERMRNAFDAAFIMQYEKVIIIGTDCFDLTAELIEEGFQKLKKADIVIGPAMDGGYYLLGMKALYNQLFENISWSTDSVLTNTLQIATRFQLTYQLLAALTDIDTEEDLRLVSVIKA